MPGGITLYERTGEFVEVTIDDSYRHNGIDKEGRKWSLSPMSSWKNQGAMKVRRYIRKGMKFTGEIVRRFDSSEPGGLSGMIDIRDDKK